MLNVLTIIISTCVLLLALLSFLYGINKNNESKRAQVYKRLDQVKEGFKREYVSIPTCEAVQKRWERVEDDLKEVKRDIKILLREKGQCDVSGT